MVGKVVEDMDTLPEELGVVGVGGVDVENRASSGNFRERLDSDGHDNSERAGTAALESPKEVGVLLGVCSNILAFCCNGIKTKHVISSHSVDAGKRSVAASLNITACPADSLEYVSPVSIGTMANIPGTLHQQ
jgi:hypothetical protein